MVEPQMLTRLNTLQILSQYYQFGYIFYCNWKGQYMIKKGIIKPIKLENQADYTVIWRATRMIDSLCEAMPPSFFQHWSPSPLTHSHMYIYQHWWHQKDVHNILRDKSSLTNYIDMDLYRKKYIFWA